MDLRGRPDFGAAMVLHDGPAWPAFGSERWLLPPTAVALAEREDGGPAFRLSLTRPMLPMMPPAPYAVLDLTFAAGRDTGGALAELRGEHPRATVAPLHPAAGVARLSPAPGAPLLPEELRLPVTLAWNGLGEARLAMRLEPESGTLVAAMVEDGTLPLLASLALAFDGVSPRLAVEVRFDPAALVGALDPLIGAGVGLAALARLIEQTPLPLEGARDDAGPGFGATMADRLAARFGTPADLDAGSEPRIRLRAPTGSGRFVWDLSVPCPARRWLALDADPFAALRDHVAAEGASGLVTRTTAEPLPTGAHRIHAFANLPRRRAGLEALGVTLSAPALLPHRPHTAAATAMIEPPGDEARLTLRLSPGEPLAYAVQGFAVIADAQGVRRLDGPRRQAAGALLRLLPGDFALAPVTVAASPDLLVEARVAGDLRYAQSGRAHAIAFTLDAASPSLALGLPADAADGVLSASVEGLDGSGTLTLGPLPAVDTRFELAGLPGYGPQSVAIRCELPPGQEVVAIEALAQDRAEDEAETLAFTPERPERHWHYFARSPFRPGWRWRPRAAPGMPAAPWRLVASAEPLRIGSEAFSGDP